MARSEGIKLKKQFGQHFLRDHLVLSHMIDAVEITPQSTIIEIGCGDGFLTSAILKTNCARVEVYEIDPEWAQFVQKKFPDSRLTVNLTNFLDIDLDVLAPYAPCTVLSNLPYQVTFPILHRFHKYRHYIKEGVVMIQEEVAQKLVKKSGRGYGFASLYFQYFFELRLLTKIPPTAFFPPPKVFSRLLYFKTKQNVAPIKNEEAFWKFIQQCFAQPRRTLANNLKITGHDTKLFSAQTLALRAQQMNMADFLSLWDTLQGH
jgi:Dimethyladenosine transferase (rRNA methylation)